MRPEKRNENTNQVYPMLHSSMSCLGRAFQAVGCGDFAVMKTFSLFNNGIWRISAYRNINTGNASLKVENLKTGFVDWPIRYDDGRIAYDYPERLPVYVRRKVQSIYAPSNNQWASLIDAEKAGVI